VQRKRGWMRLAAVAAAVGVCMIGGATGASASNDLSFADPTGDGGAAADVTSVRVTNDDAGLASIAIQFSNRSALGNEAVVAYLDTDADTGTGNAGSEYRLRYFGGSVPQMKLEHWDGTAWDENAPQSSFSGAFDAATKTLTFTVSTADIGGTTKFNFFVFTAATGTTDQDYAPDSGRYTYPVVIGSPTPPPPPPPPPAPPASPPPPPPPTVTTLSDADHDGTPDAKDACPRLAAGRYDRNHNGCPGPYGRMSPAFRAVATTSGGFTTYSHFVVTAVAPGAAVTISFRGSLERRRASKGGVVASRIVVGKRVRAGTAMTIRASKRGVIGYAARLAVTTVSPAYRVVQVRCIAATGSSAPKACSRVSRGR
jgi:hypothetical protein